MWVTNFQQVDEILVNTDFSEKDLKIIFKCELLILKELTKERGFNFPASNFKVNSQSHEELAQSVKKIMAQIQKEKLKSYLWNFFCKNYVKGYFKMMWEPHT